MDLIAVMIPCYNEELTIEKVVTDFRQVLPEAKIYVYDNNSTDHTAEYAERAGAIVRYEPHQGKGNVIRRMFREIDAECYVMVDGDDTYPAEHAPELVDLVLKEHVDMAVGDRLSSTYYQVNKRRFHNRGNAFVMKSINALFDVDIKDMLTGYRAFSYEFVKTCPVLARGFEVETQMSIHAADKNMLIKSVPVQYRDRPEGGMSKLQTIPDGAKVLMTILRLWATYKPMVFFGIVSAVLAALSVGFFVPVFREFLRTGLVLKFPTLILCGFTMIAAIQAFFSGLQMQAAVRKNREDFEMQLIQAHDRKNQLI